jgi:hypothetical protein
MFFFSPKGELNIINKTFFSGMVLGSTSCPLPYIYHSTFIFNIYMYIRYDAQIKIIH